MSPGEPARRSDAPRRHHATRHGLALAACSLAFFAAGARAQLTPGDSLTIRGCIARAWQLAPEVFAARADQQAADLDVAAALHNASPRVAFQTSALVAPSRFYDPALTNLGEYGVKLVGTVPVRDGGEARRERARTRLVAGGARTGVRQTRRDVALRVAELASGILRTSAEIGRREEARRWTESVMSAVASGARAGTRSPSDALRLRLELEGTDVDLLTLRAARETLGRALATLIAPDSLGASITAIRDTLGLDLAPAAEDSARVLERFTTSSEVQRAENETRVARLELEAAHARRALHLDLTLDAGLAGTDLTRWIPPNVAPLEAHRTLADRLRLDAGASLALDLRFPLVTPGAGAAVAAREAALHAAEARAEAARRGGRQEALDLLSRWSLAARRRVAHQRSVVEAAEHVQRIQSLYLAGATTVLELLDARRLLEDARGRLEEARAELRLAILDAEIGR